MKHQSIMIVGGLVALCLVHSLPGFGQPKKPPVPVAITMTTTPLAGGGENSSGEIAGTVTGVDFTKHKIVIYSHTNTWYVQPTAAEPLTEIDEKGKWDATIHLGHDYAVLLVKDGYSAPATLQALPKTGGSIIFVKKVVAKSP